MLRNLTMSMRAAACAVALLLAACGGSEPPANLRYATNGDMKIHWQEQGSGTPVLLIMGHRYSSRMWYPVIPVLAQHHRVISFDNRGTGYSGSTPDFTVQDMAKDALAVMDAAGVDKAHVYGVSLGGGISYELALQQPQRVLSLVLGCTRLKTQLTEVPWMRRISYYIPAWLMNRLMTASKGSGSLASPESVEFARDVLLSDPYSASGVVGQALATSRYQTTTEAVKAKLTMPALVLHGDEDATVPYESGKELAQALPNARFETLKGAGHNFFLAQRDLANKLVLDFFKQVDGKP